MIETEQAGALPSQFVWTKGGNEATTPNLRSSSGLVKVYGLLGLTFLTLAGLWGAIQTSDMPMPSGNWRVIAPIVAVVAGSILVWFSLLTARLQQRRAIENVSKNEEAARSELSMLKAELQARQRAETDIVGERERWQIEISDLKRKNEALTAELERRRSAERNLSARQLELSRSKDVLQLHVQARTQELEKVQRRSELILNSADDGICGLDLDGKVTFANPAAGRILGLPPEQFVGQTEVQLFPGIQLDAGDKPLREFAGVRRDGSKLVVEFVRSPLSENGRVIGGVLMFKDITSRKQAEEALATQAEELARSNAELEQFAFVASHDLQEPLRKIQAFGDRLKAKCDEAKLEAGRDYLERMQSAAARMRRLIDDLLTFSRVLSRTEPFTDVNLTHTVKEVLGDLEFRVEKSGAKIEVGDLPTVEADSVQMRQLIQNLLSNALKFQPPDNKPHIKVNARIVSIDVLGDHTIHLDRSAAELAAPRDEKFCELTIQDNGIGFDEKYLDKIFAVFQRLHGLQQYEGTGVGLAVCRRIVDRHGGKITAQSKLGEGATFIVTLPLRQRTANPKNA